MNAPRQMSLFEEWIEIEPIEPVGLAGGTSAEQFEAFHRANPHVLDAIVRLARSLKRRGHAHCGMKMLFERLRWLFFMQSAGERWKLNNNFTSYYARLVMAVCPDLDGFFRTRRQVAPYTPDWGALGIAPPADATQT